MKNFNLDIESYKKIIDKINFKSSSEIEDLEIIKKNLIGARDLKSEKLYYSKKELERLSFEENLKITVLDIIDEIINYGVEQGLEIGLLFGIEKTQKDIIERLIKNNISEYTILDILNITEEHYRELKDEI